MKTVLMAAFTDVAYKFSEGAIISSIPASVENTGITSNDTFCGLKTQSQEFHLDNTTKGAKLEQRVSDFAECPTGNSSRGVTKE